MAVKPSLIGLVSEWDDLFINRSFVIKIIGNVFYQFGYIKGHGVKARKFILTGLIELRWYNSTFQYWTWYKMDKKHNNKFTVDGS